MLHYVHSFTGGVNDVRLRRDHHHQLYQSDNDCNTKQLGCYGIGGCDLSQRWIELVRDDDVTATTIIKDDDEDRSITVRYGVRLSEGKHLLEFAEIMDDDDDKCTSSMMRNRVLSINETLSEMQKDSQDGLAIKAVYNDPYVAQLQLVRTLRPPRSKNMSNSGNKKVSCIPPVYDASKDSFLVGPLRLFGVGEFHGEGEPRERTARVSVPVTPRNGHDWDIYHNISPGDPRGHFLLLPALDDKEEWRDQSLTSTDCYDMTYLASTIEPIGSMVLSFNSVSAGASQNHIHCHSWCNPPPPLLNREYAVEKATSLNSLQLKSGVTVSLLDYPCTCIKLSASISRSDETLKVTSSALSKVVHIAQSSKAPHNVAWMNSSEGAEKSQQLAIYVFFRKAEVTNRIKSVFRLGASEMLGVFHCSSNEQLDSISNNIKDILKDVSLEDSSSIWRSVCEALNTDALV